MMRVNGASYMEWFSRFVQFQAFLMPVRLLVLNITLVINTTTTYQQYTTFLLVISSSVSRPYLYTMLNHKEVNRNMELLQLFMGSKSVHCCSTCGKFLTNKEHSKLLCAVNQELSNSQHCKRNPI